MKAIFRMTMTIYIILITSVTVHAESFNLFNGVTFYRANISDLLGDTTNNKAIIKAYSSTQYSLLNISFGSFGRPVVNSNKFNPAFIDSFYKFYTNYCYVGNDNDVLQLISGLIYNQIIENDMYLVSASVKKNQNGIIEVQIKENGTLHQILNPTLLFKSCSL